MSLHAHRLVACAERWVVHALQKVYIHSYSRVGLPYQGTLRTITVTCTRAPTQSRGTRQQRAGRRAQAGIASAALASAAVGVTNVVGTVVAASLMDRAGRKQLLALSFGGMGLSMLAMAAGLGLPSLAPYAGPVALVRALARGRGAGGPGVVCADAASLQSLCVQYGAGGPRTGAAVVGAGSAAAGRARAARGARGLSRPWRRAQVGTLAYIVSFALGAGPVPGLLVPEITPLRLRGAGQPSAPRTPPCALTAPALRAARRARPTSHSNGRCTLAERKSVHASHLGAQPLQRSRAGGRRPNRARGCGAGRAVSASLVTH